LMAENTRLIALLEATAFSGACSQSAHRRP